MRDDVLPLVLGQTARFLDKRVDSAKIDRDGCLDRSLLDEAGAIGLFGLAIPQAYGGLGLDLGSTCIVVSEIARRDRSVATTIGLHNGLGTRGLVAFGDDEARSRLGAMAEGRTIGAFAATEASAGSDLTSIRTTAVQDGDDFVVSGEKVFVTNAEFAGLFTMLVRTPGYGGSRGMSLVCIPRETAGLRIGAPERKLGIRGSSTASVQLENVRIPRRLLLGEPGNGLEHAYAVLRWGRTIMAAGCLGVAESAFEKSLAHCNGRKQFSRPLADFAMVKEHLCTMRANIHAMRLGIRRVARLDASDSCIEMESSIVKVFASEAAWDAADRAIQLHGGLGVIEDTGVARLARDCRVTRIFEGANDVLLSRIGATLLMPTIAGCTKSSVEARLDGPVSDSLHGAQEHLRRALDELRRKFGVAAMRHPLALSRLARAHVLLWMADCVAQERDDTRTEEPALLANYTVRRLVRRAREFLSEFEIALDDAREDRLLFDSLHEVRGSQPRTEVLSNSAQASQKQAVFS